MNTLAAKLAKRYKIEPEQAQALVDAGYKTPKDIIRATGAELRSVEGIGGAALKKLRR